MQRDKNKAAAEHMAAIRNHLEILASRIERTADRAERTGLTWADVGTLASVAEDLEALIDATAGAL